MDDSIGEMQVLGGKFRDFQVKERTRVDLPRVPAGQERKIASTCGTFQGILGQVRSFPDYTLTCGKHDRVMM